MTDASLRPIGVFDSGVGGLTVLQAMRERLPAEAFLYLGDTARLPYGTKSPQTVERYAERAAEHLVNRGIKLLVVACNTASAVALQHLRERFAPLPIIGVVGPGARAAIEARPAAHHLVLATEATVRLHAYRDAVAALDPAATVTELPCEMLVALAEEGWTDDAIAIACVRRYLAPFLDRPAGLESIILGCTHFPLLSAAVREVVGPQVSIVDSARTTAAEVAARLQGEANGLDGSGTTQFLATDGATRFARVGSLFLGTPLDPASIELTDL